MKANDSISYLLGTSRKQNLEIGQDNGHIPSDEQALAILAVLGVDGDFQSTSGSGNYFRSGRHWRDWAICSWDLQVNPMPNLRQAFPSLSAQSWQHIQYVFHAWQNWETEAE